MVFAITAMPARSVVCAIVVCHRWVTNSAFSAVFACQHRAFVCDVLVCNTTNTAVISRSFVPSLKKIQVVNELNKSLNEIACKSVFLVLCPSLKRTRLHHITWGIMKTTTFINFHSRWTGKPNVRQLWLKLKTFWTIYHSVATTAIWSNNVWCLSGYSRSWERRQNHCKLQIDYFEYTMWCK